VTEAAVPAYDRAAELGRRDAVLPRPGELDAILETRGLSVAYGGHEVLSGIFCHFPPTTVTAIMGPSGCGKSTLVKALNRTLELTPGARVSAGEVWFRGTSLYAPGIDPKSLRKRIGIIHQKPITFPMSIVENVLFGARFHGMLNGIKPRDYAALYLDRVGLLDEVKDRLDAPGHKLSGGQQQRLCLARTLANQPEVILMDEPCSAIDPAATQRIEELILKLKADYTIVIVTHNIGQAKRVSDQAIFMFGGQVIEAGASDRLFREPRTQLAQRFISGAIG
jgi:phosphate transport system ATP-binding protein